MELTKRLWDSMGYSQLSKTSQNLADKYRHLQKTANIPSLLIQAKIQSQQSRQNETMLTADNNIVDTHETGVEREDSSSSIGNYDFEFPNGLLKLEIATEPWITIYNNVLKTFHSIKSQPGNFEIRTENSRVKKKPSVIASKELDQIAVNQSASKHGRCTFLYSARSGIWNTREPAKCNVKSTKQPTAASAPPI